MSIYSYFAQYPSDTEGRASLPTRIDFYDAYLDTRCLDSVWESINQKLLDFGYACTHGFDLENYIHLYLEQSTPSSINEENAKCALIRYILDMRGITDSLSELNGILNHKLTLHKATQLFKEELLLRYMCPVDEDKKSHYLKKAYWTEQDWTEALSSEDGDKKLLSPTTGIRYTEEEIRETNMWRKVGYQLPHKRLYEEVPNRFLIYEGDEFALRKFNRSVTNPDYQYRLEVAPQPFSGNVLGAKLIILSLNPGYVDRANRLIAILLQRWSKQLEAVRQFHQKELFLEAERLDIEEDTDKKELTDNEALNLLGDFYWADNLKRLETEGLTHDQVMKGVALIQYVGYHSVKFDKDFPSQTIVPSQLFLKKLIAHLVEMKPDTYFLILRAEDRWKKFLGPLYETLDRNHRIIRKHKSNSLSQALSENNLGTENFHKIINLLKRS